MADEALNSPEIRFMLDLLQSRIRDVLGAKLLGLYVVGSLVTGDFDFRSSDIDLIAALSAHADEAQVQRLDEMHASIARDYPRWDDRIEVIYIASERLTADRAHYTIAKTGPGEPFHVKEIVHEQWMVNWYVLREKGIPLLGANPQTFVAPVLPETLVRVVREQSRSTLDWLDSTSALGSQAYAILTLCRALRTVRTSEFVSKLQAASWTAAQFPAWASLIERALIWRAAGTNQMPGHAAAFHETQRFITFMIDQITRTEG